MDVVDRFGEYDSVELTLEGEILQLSFHSDGDSLVWNSNVNHDFALLFSRICLDAEVRVVIMTGTGTNFSGPPAHLRTKSSVTLPWETIRAHGIQLTTSMLDIPVPVISCLNGPAYRHAEIPLLADVVLAAPEALIQDTAHFTVGTTPGDGVHVFLPLLLGWNRGRHFLLTGAQYSAEQLHEFGVVSEVLPREHLLPRAWDLARDFASRDPLVLRYTRRLLTAPLRSLAQDYLGEGLALEALGATLRERAAAESGVSPAQNS